VVLYKELATLAQLVPGRLEIGMGAGWLRADFTRAGVPFDPPSTRIERLDEAVTILKGLWRQQQFSMDGKHYSIVDASGDPRPPTAEQPRWTLGGGGRRVLAVAARHADIVSMSARLSSGSKDATFGASATAGAFVRRARLVRQLAGDRIADIELQTLVFAVAIVPDSGRYAERVLSRMFGLPAAEALASPLALVGTVGEVCERLAAHRDLLGTSYWVIPAAQMTGFAGVVAKLSGG
jgi:probable F420-dependent oxidoreductase